MTLAVCSAPNCPELIPRGSGRCIAHARLVDRARGTRQERGYDRAHERERKRWARILERRTVPCARCSAPVNGADAWHLDHTDDRAGWLGPSHATCNLSAAGRASHAR